MDISKFLEKAKEQRLLGIKITKDGEKVAEWFLEGDEKRIVFSVSKSFTAIAVGYAIEDGLLSLDEKLVDVFKDELPEVVSESLQKATVRDLLTMCLGQAKGYLFANRCCLEEKNWVKLALSYPFELEPKTKLVYNNVGPYLAAVLVQRRCGKNLVDYMYPKLFEPLGIQYPTWEVCPMGYSFGASGLMLCLEDLHKFGLVLLNKGKWQGKQVINEKWIEECSKPQDDERYGYLFWRGPYNSYRADGKYGQYVIVMPDKNAVVSVQAESREQQKLLDLIFNEVCSKL